MEKKNTTPKNTISTENQLFHKRFPDNKSARLYIESILWKSGRTCGHCRAINNSIEKINKRGFYHCRSCRKEFSIRTNTIFARSHMPFHKWLYAMHLLHSSRNGISSVELGKQIRVTQKTAWFVLQRIRRACAGEWRLHYPSSYANSRRTCSTLGRDPTSKDTNKETKRQVCATKEETKSNSHRNTISKDTNDGATERSMQKKKCLILYIAIGFFLQRDL